MTQRERGQGWRRVADFFVSYTSADAAKAAWIAHTLREAGFTVRFAGWLDPAYVKGVDAILSAKGV